LLLGSGDGVENVIQMNVGAFRRLKFFLGFGQERDALFEFAVNSLKPKPGFEDRGLSELPAQGKHLFGGKFSWHV
jgi:hypothetical protein